MKPTFDAHVHLWDHPWENFIVGTHRAGRFAQRDLLLSLMDRHGVERACVLAACNQQNPQNNEFVAGICRAQPGRFVMFSSVPLADPSRDGLLEKTAREWPAIGLRYMLAPGETPASWCGDADAGFWRRINDLKLFVALNLNPAQAAALPPLIKQYPDITWLIDHMGRPRYDMDDKTYQPVLQLAAYENVYVKISGFYAFTRVCPDYPYHDLGKSVKKLLDRFGCRRLLWGSDAPPVLDFSSYEQSFACLRHLLPGVSDEDLSWIMGGTARQLFGARKP